MKNKIAKTIIQIISIFLIIIALIIIYYLTADIYTKMPEEVEEVCKITVERYMERNVFIITPKEQKTDTKILYFHGGAYVAEATKQHWQFIEKMAKDTGATVILPDYPLTPKYIYSDVFEMIEPLYKDIVEKIGSEHLVIMGDSAGGGMGLALEEKIGKDGIPMPAKTILISPWLDVSLSNPHISEIQKLDTELNKDTLILAGISYASNDGVENYLVSPINGPLDKLKDITILIGTHDILNPDVKLLQEKAEDIGVQIDVKEYEKAKHIWIIEKNSSEELIEEGYQDIINLIK